jgi:uncharacterized protein
MGVLCQAGGLAEDSFCLYAQCMRLNVPFIKQSTDYTCGPTALQMVLQYFGKFVEDKTICAMASTTDKNGTPRKGLIRTLQILGLETHFHSNSSIAELKFFLDQGAPVIVGYRDLQQDESHFGVVVGYEDEYLLLHDPSEETPFTPIFVQDFLDRWYGRHTKQHTRWMLAALNKPFVPFEGDIVGGLPPRT